jgi:hypothetical protein
MCQLCSLQSSIIYEENNTTQHKSNYTLPTSSQKEQTSLDVAHMLKGTGRNPWFFSHRYAAEMMNREDGGSLPWAAFAGRGVYCRRQERGGCSSRGTAMLVHWCLKNNCSVSPSLSHTWHANTCIKTLALEFSQQLSRFCTPYYYCLKTLALEYISLKKVQHPSEASW